MHTKPSEVFLGVYDDIMRHGRTISPRGQVTREIENYGFTMDPLADRFTSFRTRGVNFDYMKKELLWYLRGNRQDMMITEEAQIWKDIVDVDNGINSNYGQYLFAPNKQAAVLDSSMQFMSAIDYIVDALSSDPHSRRAVVPLLHRGHLRPNNPDVVCTYYMAFRIRDGKLNMTVGMRSWDVVWGMTNDVFCFSCIYEIVLRRLQSKHDYLEAGSYYHHADSAHIYSRHFEKALKMVDNGYDEEFYKVNCPEMTADEATRMSHIAKYGDIHMVHVEPGDERTIDDSFWGWLNRYA